MLTPKDIKSLNDRRKSNSIKRRKEEKEIGRKYRIQGPDVIVTKSGVEHMVPMEVRSCFGFINAIDEIDYKDAQLVFDYVYQLEGTKDAARIALNRIYDTLDKSQQASKIDALYDVVFGNNLGRG